MLIVFDKVAFSFEKGDWTLSVPDLHIRAGEFIAIVGENGSGKSTLARLAAGLLAPTSGTVRICGFDTAASQESFLARSNMGFVFQNPDDQIIAAIVEDEVAFGPQNLGLMPDEVHARVTGALKQVGLEGFEEREVASLSGGQKQRLALAGALAMNPRVLILDEASSMLDPEGRRSLMLLCQQLHDSGIAIVLITHFMDEAVCAERILAIHEGRLAASGTPQEIFANQALMKQCHLETPFAVQVCASLRERGINIETYCTEQKLVEALAARWKHSENRSDHYKEPVPSSAQSNEVSQEQAARDDAEPVLSFEQLHFSYDEIKRHAKTNWALQEVSFSIKQGTCLGVAGHTGSGKSTLLAHMNGLLEPQQGCIRIQGRRLETKRDRAWARTQVGLVFQYPERQLFASSVVEDVSFGPRNLGFSPAEIQESSFHALEFVGLDPADIAERNPFKLSGGVQRRVALAGILAMKPRILVLDEPGAGLDPQSHRDFVKLIQSLRQLEDLTLVIASHDMDDLADLCDQVLLLRHGTVAAQDSPAVIFKQTELLQELSLEAPKAERFAQSLTRAGIPLAPLPQGRLHTLESVADALCACLRTAQS